MLQQERFGKFAGIELYMPSKWDNTKCQFTTQNDLGGHKDGQIANYHHTNFSRILDMDKGKNTSLQNIQTVLNLNSPTIKIFDNPIGFKARNTLVAKNCDYMIALTFHQDIDQLMNSPNGGTVDTMKKANHLTLGKNKLHFNLNSL